MHRLPGRCGAREVPHGGQRFEVVHQLRVALDVGLKHRELGVAAGPLAQLSQALHAIG
jgi:hypothetical protein